jgi:predicted small lipoprotein YifL
VTVRPGARVAIALLALLPAGLSGCGQTGPLYLPDDDGATVVTRPGPAATGPATTTPAVPGAPTTGNDAAPAPPSSTSPSSTSPAPATEAPGASGAAPPVPTDKPPSRRGASRGIATGLAARVAEPRLNEPSESDSHLARGGNPAVNGTV